jgi:hypothetical protein
MRVDGQWVEPPVPNPVFTWTGLTLGGEEEEEEEED